MHHIHLAAGMRLRFPARSADFDQGVEIGIVAALMSQDLTEFSRRISRENLGQVRALVDHYMGNAKILRAAVTASGLKVWGGENAPYIWVQAPAGVSSWDAFDKILNEANVVVTPGAGFGSEGEGYFRISAFNSRENAEEVARRWAELSW